MLYSTLASHPLISKRVLRGAPPIRCPMQGQSKKTTIRRRPVLQTTAKNIWLAGSPGADSHPFPPRRSDGGGQPLILTRYSIFRGGARDGVAFWAAAARARRSRRRKKRHRTVFRRRRARTHRFPKEFFLDQAPKSGWLARHTAAGCRFGPP